MRHIQDKYGAKPEYLWKRCPNYAVFRHAASRGWFALIADVPRDRLGLEGRSLVDVMNVKCGPILLGSLLEQQGFLPAWHMSKSSWVSILLDGTVPDGQIFPLLELSYDSVAPKSRKTP